MSQPGPSLGDDIGALLGAPVTTMAEVRRGHHTRHRVRVDLADGRRAFVKADDRSAQAAALVAEHRVNRDLPAGLGPALIAFGVSEASGRTLLAFERVDDVRWPPPWTPGDLDAVGRLLDEVGGSRAPASCPPLTDFRSMLSGWEAIAAAPRSFAALGVRSSAWLERALPDLQVLAGEADLDGDSLVHFDVRSDNLYLLTSRAGLVDWAWAAQGPAGFDLLAFLPSVHSEGGPPPWEVAPGADAAVVALIAGYWASQAVAPEPVGTNGLRQLQRDQLTSAVAWLEQLGVAPAS